ncbi:MAG TPA: iron transporter [Rhizomicrobium sp.]|nr:iron transporter [Rhizomicrobium sp.]
MRGLPLIAVPMVALGAASASAAALAIGEKVSREGMEIAAQYRTGVEMDRMPAGMGMGKEAVHLEAVIHAARDEVHGFAPGAWIPYLDIHYELTKDGEKTFKRTGILFPMAAKDGPTYANDVDMGGAGSYRLTYFIAPPSAHGFLRQTDKATGVPDWWKPITLNWTFTYPGKTT